MSRPASRPRFARLGPAVAIVALAIVPLSASAWRQNDARYDQIAALVTEKMKQYGVPGVAMGIVKNRQTWIQGFGATNVDEPQPITAETVFPIASISKTMAATAIMRLVEQKQIDLDAPVRRYLPDFRVGDEAATRDVAIWHLLTHTPGWEGQLTPEDRGTQTLPHFVDTMKDLPQLASPGEVWSYNNAGFSVAGRVIEAVTGRAAKEHAKAHANILAIARRAAAKTNKKKSLVQTAPETDPETGGPPPVPAGRKSLRVVN